MAGLPEDSTNWPSEIYQLEAADPVLGGVPNISTGAGKSNIPLVMLADRTAFLKARIGGYGATAGQVTDLDALAITGMFEVSPAATGHPDPGDACQVHHVEGATNASQLMVTPAGKTWSRGRLGATWGDWELHWSDDGADKLLAQTGYRKHPDGMIEQWGYTAGGFVDGHMPMTFPVAFPNACWQVSLADGSTSGTLGNVHHLTYYNVTTTGFTAMASKADASDWSATQFSWRALGI